MDEEYNFKATLDAEVLMAESEPSKTIDAVRRATRPTAETERFYQEIQRKRAADWSNYKSGRLNF